MTVVEADRTAKEIPSPKGGDLIGIALGSPTRTLTNDQFRLRPGGQDIDGDEMVDTTDLLRLLAAGASASPELPAGAIAEMRQAVTQRTYNAR